MILLCSEDAPEEAFPASRVISSQILGYDGREVDTKLKERAQVIFPVNVSLHFMPATIMHIRSWVNSTLICISISCCENEWKLVVIASILS